MSRRSWTPRERARRRRLRAGYRGSLAQRERELEAKRQQYEAAANARAKAAELAFQQRADMADAQVAKLAKEILRLKLEWGPGRFGSRFTIYARLSEQFVLNTRDLKEFGPFVVDKLAMLVKREFAQIDFARAQPVRWDYDEYDEHRGYPVFRIEPPDWPKGTTVTP